MEQKNKEVFQDGSSTFSTKNTNKIQPQFQTQPLIRRNYEPPPESPKHNSHSSPQTGISASSITNTNLQNKTQTQSQSFC